MAMTRSSHITKERLRELFRYDPASGALHWRLSRQGIKADSILGSIATNPAGRKYLRCKVEGRYYAVHRLVWVIINGEIPDSDQIDHIDHDGLNNTIWNLRIVDSQSNARNRILMKTNTSGVCGVYRTRNRFYSQIKIDGKTMSLGSFDNIFDATASRKSAENYHGFSTGHGERRISQSLPQRR